MFKKSHFYGLFLIASVSILGACGDAKTTIIEKDPIVNEDEHNDEHNHHEHEAHGRLAILNTAGAEALVFDLEDNSLLDAFALSAAPSAMHASAGYRFAVLVDRAGDTVRFLDGGLWQEDHVEHLHDYEEAPVLLDYTLNASRPTHVDKHGDQLAIFFDGNADTSTPASITIISDTDIAAANATPLSIDYAINMHGVAKPRGEHLLATWRRDDADNTSANPILPDQVAVYHLHEGEYEQEQILDVNCPDLHGAAQNESYVIFGCSDGVLIAHTDGDTYEAEKLLNSDDLQAGLRIGSIYGHEESEQFIGMASAHGGSEQQFFSIDPHENEMELIDWQPLENASVVARSFSFEAEQFLILDDQGYLTAIEPHEHDGHTHWEFGIRLDISEEDIASMPDDARFNLSLAQNGHWAYVSDPIARHIVIIDLELMEIIGEIELDFVPGSIAWLGIAGAHEE